MYFTREDLLKIHNWLKANSVKDTDFARAETPLHEGDSVAIVQDGVNKQLPLSYLKQNFKICTHEEYEELVYSRNINTEVVYGLLTADGTAVDLIFFGYIPFSTHGATRSLDHAEDWVIVTDIENYTKKVDTADVESKVLSYKEQALTVHYSATRNLVYKWSDDRPNTTEVEYGQVSFEITVNGRNDPTVVTWEDLHTEDKAFKINITDNNNTAKRDLKIVPKVYGESTKTTFIDSENTGVLVLGMAYINMESQNQTDSTSKIVTIEVQVEGYPVSSIPIIDNSSIEILEGEDYVDINNTSIILTSTLSVYNLKVKVKDNTTNSSRDIQIKIKDLREGSTLSSTTTITQAGVGEVSITGIQLSNITGYLDAAHTQPISDPIKVQYGKNKTIYLVADEGYTLPSEATDITVSPESTSFEYNKNTGAITFKALTEDVSTFKLSAYHLDYYIYKNLTISEFEYPANGSSVEGDKTQCTSLRYNVTKEEHFINGEGTEIINEVTGITTGGTTTFSFTAKDASDNTINDPTTVATIDSSTGTLTWKLNSSGHINKVIVKVKVSFVGTDSNHTETYQEETATIIQPYATRTVTVNSEGSTGLNLKIQGATDNNNSISIPYGESVSITVSPKENYRIPLQAELNECLTINPSTGSYSNRTYSLIDGKTTLQIFGITSNITITMIGIETQTHAVPIYCGVLTPDYSHFDGNTPVSSINSTMLQEAIQEDALVVVNNLPRTSQNGNPYVTEVTTQYSYVVGLVPTEGTYANYIIKLDIGFGLYDTLTYGGKEGYAINGEAIVSINNINYRLYAVYSSARAGKTYTYTWTIFENNN